MPGSRACTVRKHGEQVDILREPVREAVNTTQARPALEHEVGLRGCATGQLDSAGRCGGAECLGDPEVLLDIRVADAVVLRAARETRTASASGSFRSRCPLLQVGGEPSEVRLHRRVALTWEGGAQARLADLSHMLRFTNPVDEG